MADAVTRFAEAAREAGVTVTISDARTVKETTGYSIGGVPPFGHVCRLRTVIDPDLLRYERVWAAAGSATAVFSLDPDKSYRTDYR